MIDPSKVAEHYNQHGLIGQLRVALANAGILEGKATAAQLAPLDQFHSRGLAATVELGKLLNPSPETTILDIGSGLGGPSRYLADTYGCRVVGIDLSPSYVDAANFLAQNAGLADRVEYHCGNGLSLPFGDGEFDVAWTQHVAMNIANRAQFYAEAHRVLRPGGRFAIYDVLLGDGGPLHYPVPWSRDASTSFLMTPEQMKQALELQGFRVISWADRTQEGVAWFEEMRKTRDNPPPLGLHMAVGPDFKIMAGNLGRNLAEDRAVLVETVLQRN